MVTRIQIRVRPQRLAENTQKRERLARTRRLLPTDRTPVIFNYTVAGILRARGVKIREYFESPAAQLRHQLLNAQWRIENLEDDAPVPERSIRVAPDLQCIRGIYFPVEVHWQEDQLPKTMPLLHDPSEIERLRIPAPHENLGGRQIEWQRRMEALAADYAVTVNGRRVRIEVGLGAPGGPIPDAFALAGEKLFLWMMEAPRMAHQLLEKVTLARLQYERHIRRLRGRPNGSGCGCGMGCDTGELLSVKQYRAFVLPYYVKIYEAFGGARGLHMCGKINHLLEMLADEMKISSLDNFGFVTSIEKLASVLGGRAVLSGGPSPMLIQEGNREKVLAAAAEYLERLAPRGGYILSSGGGVPPGTPVKHMTWLLEASQMAASSARTAALAV